MENTVRCAVTYGVAIICVSRNETMGIGSVQKTIPSIRTLEEFGAHTVHIYRLR